MISSPEANTWLRAQPASVSRWAGVSDCSAGSSWISSVSVCTDRRRLLGDVDRHRAPGDAAPAADAAGRAELVDPGRELVRHPLAVARARGAPYPAAVHVGVLEREARFPHARALARLAGEIGHILDRRAKAGG